MEVSVLTSLYPLDDPPRWSGHARDKGESPSMTRMSWSCDADGDA